MESKFKSVSDSQSVGILNMPYRTLRLRFEQKLTKFKITKYCDIAVLCMWLVSLAPKSNAHKTFPLYGMYIEASMVTDGYIHTKTEMFKYTYTTCTLHVMACNII